MRRAFIIAQLLLLAFLIGPRDARAQSFAPVFDLVDRMRQGDKTDLSVRVQGDSVSFMREQVTQLDKDAFERLLASNGDEPAPRLKYTSETTSIVYEVSDTVSAEEQTRLAAAGRPEQTVWLKKEFVPVATYPTARWPEFLKEAAKHGLTAISQYDSDGSTLLALDFKSLGPERIQYGAQSLALTPTFYEFMRLSPEYPPSAGAAGFAVIMHDPHWHRMGRFQIIPGLRALLSANRARPVFLNEGEFETAAGGTRGRRPAAEAERAVGFNGLDVALAPTRRNKTIGPIVYDLLSRYLIDSAMAYRLLYDVGIPTEAIDDPSHLPSESYGAQPESITKTLDAMERVAAALDNAKDKFSGEDYKQAGDVLLLAAAYGRARAEDIHGKAIVDYYDRMAKAFGAAAAVARILKSVEPSAPVDDDIRFLQSQEAAYRGQHEEYEQALRRDEPMAQRIAAKARSARAGLPVAFVGDFHTDGITRRLRELNIGYVVVEPRYNVSFSDKEQKEFDRYLYRVSRTTYLQTTLGTNKGPVAPTRAEVRSHYAPFARRESARIAQRERAAALDLRRRPAGELDYATLGDSLKSNGVMSNARVEFGGAGGTPPPGGGRPFAFFEPGDGPRNSKFVVMDTTDAGWNSGRSRARYNCLQEIRLLPALEADGLTLRRQVTFYQDRDSGVMFASVFEPQSRGYYLYEGEGALDNLSTLALPAPPAGKNVFIHMRLAELEELLRRREENGDAKRRDASGE